MTQDKRPDVSFVWNILDVVLRDVFRHNELGLVILPFVVLRRIDCCLRPVNKKVRESYAAFKDKLKPEQLIPILRKATLVDGKTLPFYNTSNYSFEELLDDPANIDINFKSYLNGFNEEVRDILDNFHFDSTLARIIRYGLLYNLVSEIEAVKSITPEESDDIAMGYVFEEIIRLACEENNEDAGQHFTPRDAIRLMSALLFDPVRDDLNRSGIIRSIYDPTCGTGGMVNVGKKYILEEICTDGNKPIIKTYGQELNDQSFAIAKSESLITGNDAANIKLGNTLTNDQFRTERFNFIMANPPYGTTWKKDQEYVTNESMNPDGRFTAGLPRTSDGQLLFMQHMISKMSEKGCRVGIVTSGSPLFSGGAGSGESNIRKWIIENDWLECIVALPLNLFYNTGIGTFIWILTNHKEERRKGKIQLIDAKTFCAPSKKSLGDKRNDIRPDEDIPDIMNIYDAFDNGKFSRVFSNRDFGFLELTIEQPKRDDNGDLILKNGKKQPVAELRSIERVRIERDAMQYFKTEILPDIDPDSWIDLTKTRIGYEINFQQYFYEYKQLESSADIARRIQARLKDLMPMVEEAAKEEHGVEVPMKDSGIEWVGEIPAAWKCMKTKRLFSIIAGATPDTTNEQYWDGDIPWITPADYKSQDYYVSGGKRKITNNGYDSCATTLVPKGSIIFSKRAPIGSVAIASNSLCTNQGCLSCVPKEELDTRFFYYVMSSFTEAYDMLGTGTTFKEISANTFSDVQLPCPEFEEQQSIANSLDARCAKIDAAIKALEQQCNDLKALRQSIINEAVTGKTDVSNE